MVGTSLEDLKILDYFLFQNLWTNSQRQAQICHYGVAAIEHVWLHVMFDSNCLVIYDL